MSNEFKYFQEPYKFSSILDNEHECDICHQVKTCFDASLYYGPKDYVAFCFDCVTQGRLKEVGATAVDPDTLELKTQLRKIHKEFLEEELEKKSQSITDSLINSTPQLTTWQEFHWPAHCGDYCTFIKIAGKEYFNQLAEDGNGKKLFKRTLYGYLKKITDVDSVWEGLCDASIKDLGDENCNWETSAYIFRCRVCGEVITIWDCY